MTEAISSTIKVSKASQSVSSEETSPVWYHPHPGYQTLNIQSFLMNAPSFPSMFNHHSQCSSVTQSCLTLYDPMDCSTPDCPVYHQLLEFAQTHVYRVGDAIQPSCPPLLLPPSIFPGIKLFSNELVLHIRCPKYWSFSFSISPSKEHSGLISFRVDWLDLLAVQGTLKTLLQHHSSKASISSALSFPYSPTLTSIHDHWKNHSLDKTDLCLAK